MKKQKVDDEMLRDSRFLSLLKQASKLGLALFRPHAHDARGRMTALPRGVVALEQDGLVRFVTRESPELAGGVPVAWIWQPSASKRKQMGADVPSGCVVVAAVCCSKRKPPRPDPDRIPPPKPKEISATACVERRDSMFK